MNISIYHVQPFFSCFLLLLQHHYFQGYLDTSGQLGSSLIDGSLKSGKLTSWGNGSLSHYLQGILRYYTSQVVQDFFHQQYVLQIQLDGNQIKINGNFTCHNQSLKHPVRLLKVWCFGHVFLGLQISSQGFVWMSRKWSTRAKQTMINSRLRFSRIQAIKWLKW